ncbi:MAG: glycosyltransferase family 2 protein [Phycisphaerae bacterium]
MQAVSVIMPCRNAVAFVQAAVASVLMQAGVQVELLLVDDGSTDGSADAAKAAAASAAAQSPTGEAAGVLRVLPGPERGISAAFNAGLAEASHPLLARCDADDLYPPGRLRRQADVLAADPQAVAVCGAYATIDGRGRFVLAHHADRPAADVTAELLAGGGPSHMCAYLFGTEAVRRLGGCREFFRTSEDADLQFRLAAAGPVLFDPAVAYLYRLHDASITHTEADERRKWFHQTALRFLEQRNATGADDLDRGTPPPVPVFDGNTTQVTRHQVYDMLVGEAWRRHAAGRRAAGLGCALRAARRRWHSPAAWKQVAMVGLKPTPKATNMTTSADATEDGSGRESRA